MAEQRLFAVAQEQFSSDDYYTPRWLFDALGLRFDLDVCAPPGGVPWIPCDKFFTQEDDGLSQPWVGRVWMNPPYSDVTPWWRRFSEHGNGVALLPMAKAPWIDDVWRVSDAISLPQQRRPRIEFIRPNAPERPVEIWFPVFLAAFGEECAEALSRVGVVRVATGGQTGDNE